MSVLVHFGKIRLHPIANVCIEPPRSKCRRDETHHGRRYFDLAAHVLLFVVVVGDRVHEAVLVDLVLKDGALVPGLSRGITFNDGNYWNVAKLPH